MRNTATYRLDEREMMRNLAASRRGIDLRSAIAFGEDAERARRADTYAEQYATTGRIEWLPPRRATSRPRSRFALGDILRPPKTR